ncbi:MAG TPA: hypothetical protein VMW08_06820 [Acidimicrobiales bacterium]|nr:hypothetical protein [Acidimicrobiales bacterium]
MNDRNTRPRLAEFAGVVLVAFFACFALLAGLEARTDGRRAVIGEEASTSFLQHWERYRGATYAAQTVFTRERTGGSSLRAEGLRVQRPPDELIVSLSDAELRTDEGVTRCVGGVDAEDTRCFGPTTGVPYEERVRAELDALASYFVGPEPLYEVTEREDGCFALDQVRPLPIAPYGRRATFCFDDATGALMRVEIVFDNGVIERTEVTSIDPQVTDEDLRLQPPG